MTTYKTRVFNERGKVIKTFVNERNSSKGEDAIEEWLIKNKIEYRKEKRFSWLLGANNGELRLDFYIPSLRIAIEFDGPHHDSSEYQKKNDSIKNALVRKHKIKMIRIHYSRFQLIPQILKRSIPLTNKKKNEHFTKAVRDKRILNTKKEEKKKRKRR